MTSTSTPPHHDSRSTDVRAAAAAHDRRITDRGAAAVGPRGPASFVWGDFVTEPRTTVAGAAGSWAPRPDGAPGLVVTAPASAGIVIGGRTVDGSAVLHADAADGPATAVFADGAEGIVFSYDGTRFALQVWNSGSEWARRFAGIAAYPYDPTAVVRADVRLVDSARTTTITHHRDPRPVEVRVIAEVTLEHGGIRHRLVGTEGGPGHDGIVVLFTDATSGSETYGAGRVLRLTRATGPIDLDLNTASLLPCAFSLAWNCPIPPAENALPFPLRAGERFAIDADGKELL